MDSRKSINFAKTLSVPVLGVVENMSGYSIKGIGKSQLYRLALIGPERNGIIECTSDDEGNWSMILDLFKKGGGLLAANELEVPYLGSLPFDPGIVRGGDDGVHRIVAEPDGDTAKAFDIIVENILNSLDGDSTNTLKII